MRSIIERISQRGNPLMIHLTQLLAFLAFLLCLALLSMDYGGPSVRRNFPRLELPIVASVYSALFFLLRPCRYRPVLAALPIYLFYVLYILFFLLLDKTFKLADIGLLPELVGVLPLAHSTLIVSIMLGLFFVYARFVRPANTRVAILGCLPFVMLIWAVYFSPKSYMSLFNTVAVGSSSWSEGRSAGDNGFITMVLYYQARQSIARQGLADIRRDDGYRRRREQMGRYIARHGSGRNIHIIVLESYFDPRDLSGLRFSRSPVHEALDSLVANNRSIFISPVFGGATAQVEFETLCGTPAFGHYESIEFNVFTGSKAYCLPELLRPSGYRLLASNAFKPYMFNGLTAYRGAGFDEIYFPTEYAPDGQSYFSRQTHEELMFDGDFLAQNLEFVTEHIDSGQGGPLLNYAIGIYGHTPHRLVNGQSPRVGVSKRDNGEVDALLQRFINQTYYRTESLAAHLAALMALDPKSLIIVFGDHLPSLGGINSFKELGYLKNRENAARSVPGYIFLDGHPVHFDGLHTYDIENLILDYLTNGGFCKDYDCRTPRKARLQDYREVMAAATK